MSIAGLTASRPMALEARDAGWEELPSKRSLRFSPQPRDYIVSGLGECLGPDQEHIDVAGELAATWED